MERDQYLCGVTATPEAVDLIPMIVLPSGFEWLALCKVLNESTVAGGIQYLVINYHSTAGDNGGSRHSEHNHNVGYV
ncbi:uncharacterized protein STEHIDRAFT_163812 [Stereum hirsutum FP-91666 SS1]|uniref:Uncharacterized protein n=1 Tax=Stereum hirsutum (strain FP-91666) TaxID=721885 RepID=R7RVT9_STEHR|nr:uncharacterized protein STEHIDRAFT_163812 [Stereum hirsutum FP-91666 SS1]EIM79289.1 hypothetical protein STEHIDRAFT_163812 [Stereum hirsutum FP-91666 SS1]